MVKLGGKKGFRRLTMSDRSAAGGGGSAGGGSAPGGDSSGNILNTFLLTVFPFWFHFLINLPGTNWFIGFCGQGDDFITRLYLLWIEKTPTGDFKGEQSGIGEEISHVNPRTSRWEYACDWPENPKREPGIHYHYRNFYQGLPIIVVPILSMMNHFILLTDRFIYFFRINSQNKLEVIHTIEASKAEGLLYKSCAISANGKHMVIHHKCGFSIFRISMIFGQFEVSLLKNVGLPQPSRECPFMSVIGDVNHVDMSRSGVVVVYEASHLENRTESAIKILLQNEGSTIHSVPLKGIKGFPRGQPIKSVKLCQISPKQIGVILVSIDFVLLLILDLRGEEVSLRFGAILNLGFEIQHVCPCSVNPTHFFVAGKDTQRTGQILLGYEKCHIKPVLIEIAIQGDALVKIGEQSFDKGGVSWCSYITSSGGRMIASFLGKDYRARESVIGETREVESSVPPSLSRSTLNGAPIQLEPNSVFAVLSDGEIVASNADNGLTLFGTDSKPIASTDPRDAHKSPIKSVNSFKDGSNTFLVSFSDGIIKIWSIQKRGKTVQLKIVATFSTADLVQKKGVKFLALDGQTLLIVTNQDEILRFHVEITGGIRAEISLIPGPVVQMESGQICQGIADLNSTHALIHVMNPEDRSCSLVLVSFVEGDEFFKTLGTRESKKGKPASKPPAALTRNGFAVSAVDPNIICSTPLAPDRPFNSVTPQDLKDGKLCNATILKIIFFGEDGFICITENGYLIRFVYDAQQKPIVKGMIVISTCALTPKCRIQVSGNTAMVCLPRDDGSFELLTFRF
jgi:WD40 repeat protein